MSTKKELKLLLEKINNFNSDPYIKKRRSISVTETLEPLTVFKWRTAVSENGIAGQRYKDLETDEERLERLSKAYNMAVMEYEFHTTTIMRQHKELMEHLETTSIKIK